MARGRGAMDGNKLEEVRELVRHSYELVAPRRLAELLRAENR